MIFLFQKIIIQFFFKIIIVKLLIKNKSLKLIEEKILKDKQGSTTLKILLQNKNGDFIKSYHSIGEAAKETNIDRASISKACAGILQTAGKFKWEYK